MKLYHRPFLIRARAPSIFVPERSGTESGRHGLRLFLHDPNTLYHDTTRVSNTNHWPMVFKYIGGDCEGG